MAILATTTSPFFQYGFTALPTSVEAVLSWTVREGVTDVIRHSRAHQCTIHMTRNTQEIGIEVINDGVATSVSNSHKEGNGLRGLTERVETLGGRCETVRNYLSVAIQKLNAHNRIEAAHIAEQKGWL